VLERLLLPSPPPVAPIVRVSRIGDAAVSPTDHHERIASACERDGLRRLPPNSRTLTKERQRRVVAARRRRALTLAALKSWCSAKSIPAVQTPD
jgi:hypothetical protein